MTRYIFCTAPDGTVLKRRTDRDYAHAVLAKGRDGAWTLENCSASYQGAIKARNKLQGFGYTAAIVPVRERDETAPAKPVKPLHGRPYVTDAEGHPRDLYSGTPLDL